MKQIKKIPLSRLFKMEVWLLLRSVVEALEKHNPGALNLQDSYNLLKLQLEKSKGLVLYYGKHSLSCELKELHTKRLDYATLINKQLQSLAKKDCEETRSMVKLAQRYAQKHLTYLGQKKQADVNYQICWFFMELRNVLYPEYQKAFEWLNLQSYLNDLEDANTRHTMLFNLRKDDIDARPQTGDRVLEKETQRLIQLFFEQVSYYQKIYEEIDYSPFIKMLNVELTRCSKLLKTRIATNKRRALKKALAAQKEAEAKEVKEGIKSKTSVVTKPTTKLDEKLMSKEDVKPSDDSPDVSKANKAEDIPQNELRKDTKLPKKDEDEDIVKS